MNRITYKKESAAVFLQGIRSGIPIGLGYLAVAFSLGIAASNAGLSAIEATLASILCNASAGEYAGFTVIAADSGYLSMVLMTLIANARYLLMVCAMSQRLSPDTKFIHRFFMGFYATDELFGIAIARHGYLAPIFTYGAVLMAAPGWALGTLIGAALGSVMPEFLVSAFGVTLYGMFIAVILPAAKNNKIIAITIPVCFALSYAASLLPYIKEISEGTRIIILTVLISGALAFLFPIKDEEENGDEIENNAEESEGVLDEA